MIETWTSPEPPERVKLNEPLRKGLGIIEPSVTKPTAF
jgi:hypothetical protein